MGGIDSKKHDRWHIQLILFCRGFLSPQCQMLLKLFLRRFLNFNRERMLYYSVIWRHLFKSSNDFNPDTGKSVIHPFVQIS